MFYTLYKITNNINGKIYIGTHKTNNLDDGYFGSGKYLKNSINKYGIENFTKEIMKICSSAEEMFDMEALLVSEDFVNRKDTYNIREGGFGGWDHIDNSGTNHVGNNNPFYNKKHSNKTKLLFSLQRQGKNHPMYGKPSPLGFLGKKHSEESKQKIGESNSKHQTGQGNSNYGKCWVYCPYTHENKSIPGYTLKEWEDKGWIKGRKIKVV